MTRRPGIGVVFRAWPCQSNRYVGLYGVLRLRRKIRELILDEVEAEA